MLIKLTPIFLKKFHKGKQKTLNTYYLKKIKAVYSFKRNPDFDNELSSKMFYKFVLLNEIDKTATYFYYFDNLQESIFYEFIPKYRFDDWKKRRDDRRHLYKKKQYYKNVNRLN